MKKISVVFVITENEKHHAIANTIRTGENLIPFINRYKSNICHLCENASQAEKIALAWNKQYKENGTNLY
jgi:septation ring formation regulator EzrA